MKIGIYSLSADPLHNGHIWVIDEALKVVDQLRVVLGPNPNKKPMFALGERFEVLNALGKDIICDYFTSGTVVDYIDRIAEAESLDRKDFTIFRGIRNNEDLHYEANIWQNISRFAEGINFRFVTPPQHLSHISSSWIKDVFKEREWDIIEQSVPKPTLELLRSKQKFVVLEPNVASIFETTTAGFAPASGEHFNPKSYKLASACGHAIEMRDTFEMEDVMYFPNDAMERARGFSDKLVNLGMMNFSNTVSGEQVRKTLDPFPVDVVVSDTFHLKEISVWQVEPLGSRFLSCSRTVAPIIVDRNEVIPESRYSYVYKDVGPYIVIEGKHRLLDARARGDDKILAWVGDKIGDGLDE